MSIESTVLVPRGRQPIRSQRRRQRATDDKTKISWPRCGDDRFISKRGELLNNFSRFVSIVRKIIAAHLRQQLFEIDLVRNWSIGNAVEKFVCQLSRARQQRTSIRGF